MGRRGWCLLAAERGTWHVPLVIHEEGDTVIRQFIAEFSLHYIELRRSDSLCKSNTSPMKYLAGLNIWNVANTAATNSGAVMNTCPVGEPFSTTAETTAQIPINTNLLLCSISRKMQEKMGLWQQWGTHLLWHTENHVNPHFGVLTSSPWSLFKRI